MKARVTMRIRSVAATAALLMASLVGGIAAAGPARAADLCRVSFPPQTWTVDAQDRPNYGWNDEGEWVWNGVPTAGLGFLGTFTIYNDSTAINSWNATFYSPPDTRLIGNVIWNAKLFRRTVTPTATRFQVTALSWNGSLPAGGQVSFGIQGVVADETLTASQIVTRFGLGGRPCTFVS